MAKSLRLTILEGPGRVDESSLSILARQWAVFAGMRLRLSQNRPTFPSEVSSKKFVYDVDFLSDPQEPARSDLLETASENLRIEYVPDDRRPGRRSVILQSSSMTVGLFPASQFVDPPSGVARTLVLDASWAHILRFPDREEVRQTMAEAFRGRHTRIWYVSNLDWDLQLFGEVAEELGEHDRARQLRFSGTVDTWARQTSQSLPDVAPTDRMLIGLVPGRDDRGALQRIRSDFAERSEHIQAFPTSPLSLGPGPSRDELLESVGLWLPTTVLVASGPISEQHLLARHLEENTGGAPITVAVARGEYRLPNLQMIRQVDGSVRGDGADRTVRPSSSGIVIVTDGPDHFLELAGAGLTANAREALPKIRINTRDKPPAQLVREVESAFSSRGHALPSVRFLP